MAPGYGTAVHPRQYAHEKRLQRIKLVSLWSPPRANARRVDHGGQPAPITGRPPIGHGEHSAVFAATAVCNERHVRSREMAEPSVRFACLRQRGHDVRFKGLRQAVLCDWTRHAEACMEQNGNITGVVKWP